MFRIFDQYVSRKTGFVVVGDALAIVGSIILGYKIRFWADPEGFAFYTQQPDLTLRSLTILAVLQVSPTTTSFTAPRTSLPPLINSFD
ncbi:MAG: hypothetical protein O3A53_10045 [Acidobacteria bacterium]|nr:hypothetical protein [Acidobacteriota bacterium]MDA1235131.1 hypothetical protein [Acidobacteriota bacterium]